MKVKRHDRDCSRWLAKYSTLRLWIVIYFLSRYRIDNSLIVNEISYYHVYIFTVSYNMIFKIDSVSYPFVRDCRSFIVIWKDNILFVLKVRPYGPASHEMWKINRWNFLVSCRPFSCFSTFTVGNIGWNYFKIGAMEISDCNGLRKIYKARQVS